MNNPRIVCLGEGMVEERVAADGTVTRHYGGDTLNTAIHLARLGCRVSFLTAIGCDAESDSLLAAWSGEGVDSSLVLRHPDRHAGSYRIALDAAGERSFSYDRCNSAARAMFALETAEAAMADAKRAQLFVFSLISLAILPDDGRNGLLDLAHNVRANGGQVAYDGNNRPALWRSKDEACRWHDAAIATADIGLPTLEDEIALKSEQDIHQLAAHWVWLGCGEVVVKAGSAGCLLPAGTMRPPPELFDPVDTSGAGDAFNAGYLGARLTGLDPEAAALVGHELAGWTILRAGAIPPRDAQAPYKAP